MPWLHVNGDLKYFPLDDEAFERIKEKLNKTEPPKKKAKKKSRKNL